MPQFTAPAAFGRLASLAVYAGVSLTAISLNAAEPALMRNFDGPETSWQLLETDVAARVLAHKCAPGGARDSAGSERIVIAAPGGQSVLLTCPTAQLAVIAELEVRIWVKASRPDIQLAVRIALPRTLDNADRAITIIVKGAKYDRPGHWQQLVLKDVPRLLAAQVRVMRSTPGAKIDPREAFIDAVVLAIPGEPQGVEVETDDLVVDGVFRPAADEVQLTSYPSTAGTPPGTRGSTAATAGTASVRLQGDLLLVNDRPFVPRAIQWQGEALQLLSDRGFNAVCLDRPPTSQEIAEAGRHGLWFICRPPGPDTVARDGLGEPGDRVIAWYLEDEAIESDPNYARRWAELVRERDTVSGRPIILAPHDDWTGASEAADAILARRARLGMISAADYDDWLATRSPLVRPGTPIWAHIATQFDQAVGQQVAALTGVATVPPNIDAPRLESLVQIACTRGIRGFVFDSQSSLSESDAATRLRATTVELINRRLQSIEPWLAAGKVIGRLPSADAAWTGVLLHVDRARLLIPLAEPASTKSNAETVFVVPGIPESCQVYALTPAALRTLPMQRVAGGTRLAVRPTDDAFVVMTEDPQVVQSLRQRIARDGARIVRLQRDRTSLHAASINDTARRLTQLGYNASAAAQAASNLNAQLQQIDAQLASGRVEQAHQIALAANKTMELAAAEQRRSIDPSRQLSSNPLILGHERLAEFAAFQRTSDTFRRGENLLFGGDFEDLGQMTQFGWQHVRDPLSSVESRAELSAVDPRHGSYCLALHAAGAAADNSPPKILSAPLWIQSPSLPVTGGQRLEITGWVRIDEPIIGSDDGLQIVDSLGGPDLSLAIQQTAGWQRFQMIRAVPESTELRLTFALTGVGAARLDAVMVRTLEQPLARPLPTMTAAPKLPEAGAVKSSGPLLVTPQTR